MTWGAHGLWVFMAFLFPYCTNIEHVPGEALGLMYDVPSNGPAWGLVPDTGLQA